MENLKMRKIAKPLVPYFLSKSERQWRVIISKELQVRHMDEGEIMLKCVVLINETWIRSFEHELKRLSRAWLTPNCP